jgi:hypothetical protein
VRQVPSFKRAADALAGSATSFRGVTRTVMSSPVPRLIVNS